MAHTQPPLSTVEPAFTATYHGQIKTWLEEITQSNPFVQVDWTAYQTVLSWASRADLLPIVDGVVRSRLTGRGAATQKKKAHSLLKTNSIASSLLETAEKVKAETAKSKASDEEKKKWELWCGLYGTPTGLYQMPALPVNPEWGLWSLVWVPQEEWWTAPKEVGK